MNKNIFHKLTNIGIDNNDNQTVIAQQTKAINILCLYAIVGLIGFGILNARLGFYELVLVDGSIALVALAAMYLNHKKQYEKGKAVLFIVGPLFFLYFPLFVCNVGNQYYNLMFLTIGFYVFDNKKQIFYYTTYIAFLHGITLYLLKHATHDEKYKILEPINDVPSMITAIVLIIIIVVMFKFDTIKYQRRIDNQNAELEKKVEELAEKHDFANNLLKELNHRVKNNLQLVSSLFLMQSYKTTDAATKQALDEARNRIDTVALVHQRLYKDNTVLETNLKTYITELTNYVLQSSGHFTPSNIELTTDDIFLKTEKILHIGLIVNEMMTNILKHGLNKNNEPNKVAVSVLKELDVITILICDNGTGFPPNFTVDKSNSFGLELVNSIIFQHEGSIHIENNSGAMVTITLKM